MLLTVAIPNLNGAAFIETAISSCSYLNLPSDEFEILVLDNASTDDSIASISRLKPSFPNLRIVENNSNIGRLPNWRKCFEEAHGKYLHYLFITDLFHEQNNLYSQVKLLEAHRDISMVLSSVLSEYSPIRHVPGKILYPFDRVINSREMIISFAQKGILPFGALQSNLFRVADILNKGIIFTERCPYRADNIFCAEAALQRENVFFSALPVVKWGIYKNPDRFHSRLKIESMVEDDIRAFKIINGLLGGNTLKFENIYSAELRSILNHAFFSRDILSAESGYLNATLKLIKRLHQEHVNIFRFLASFIKNSVTRGIEKIMD